MFETVISPSELAERLSGDDFVLVDCRYVLGKPGRGLASYQDKHLPGAVYADLEDDLSGPVVAGSTGRHPLPDKRDFVSLIRRLGITNGSQVVAYDEGPGYMAAARLWWMLKWSGHDAVAVLNGGLRHWTDLGLPLEREVRTPRPGDFQPHFRDEMVVSAAEIEDSLDDGGLTLIDSRSPDRFRGENETIDPVAGHIPGAQCLPFHQNLDSTSAFLSPGDLKHRFLDLLGEQGASGVAFYCGSGVTAAHNVLAFCHAGLGLPRLYPGSWSEWITDRSRPVETGPQV